MKNVRDKSCRENKKTHLIFKFFFSKIMPFMKNFEKYVVAREAIGDAGNVRFACPVTEARMKICSHNI